MTEVCIPRSPEYYGSDATEEDAAFAADVIATKVRERYPVETGVFIRFVPETISHGNRSSGTLAMEIEEWIQKGWCEWIEEAGQ